MVDPNVNYSPVEKIIEWCNYCCGKTESVFCEGGDCRVCGFSKPTPLKKRTPRDYPVGNTITDKIKEHRKLSDGC